ncbi:hypothetical protein D3C72_1987580 [compost metagenome]
MDAVEFTLAEPAGQSASNHMFFYHADRYAHVLCNFSLRQAFNDMQHKSLTTARWQTLDRV